MIFACLVLSVLAKFYSVLLYTLVYYALVMVVA